jgi:hypothetical protein
MTTFVTLMASIKGDRLYVDDGLSSQQRLSTGDVLPSIGSMSTASCSLQDFSVICIMTHSIMREQAVSELATVTRITARFLTATGRNSLLT